MDRNTVFTKTAKGITQVNQKSASLSKDLMKVLKLIDGKSNFSQIMEKADLDKQVLEKALIALQKDGFARVFETRKEEADPFAGDDDFDFTAPGKLPGQTQRVIAAAANDISELSRQQDVRDTAKKAMTQAQDVARAKAKHEAENRAKLEADARAKAEAEQRAMEQARRAREASERAKAELEAKMREETQRHAALAAQQAQHAAAQKAKEAEEAKKLAEMRAKAEAEANQRAKAELEAKMREEVARQAEVAAQQAQQAVVQKAKDEEESRRLAQMRAKAETEAKTLSDARSKAEAEAQALARARAEAEAAAKKGAAEAGAAEKELKARLKDEIEARIRSEMEQLLRNEIEEKARGAMQAEIMAEAKLAAKAELEERLAEERAALQKVEMEARVAAEKMQRERADQEAKLRMEAERRAAVESAARAKAEQETEELRRQAVKANELAAQQAEEIRRQAAQETEKLRRAADVAARDKEEAARRLEAERRGKIEAEARAMVEAEEGERREKELAARIELEKRAREDAEMRVKIESRARETIEEDTRAKVQAELEGDMSKRAEIEGKAQAKAYMHAKAKAEHDEDERLRTEQARKAREIADILRTKVEPDFVESETPAAKKRRPRRRKGLVKNIFIALIVLLAIGVGLLHVIPMRSFATKVEKGMSGWLHDDVRISSVKFWLVPTPHLKIEGMTVGKLLDATALSGRIYLDIGGFFSDQIRISSLELDGVSLSADAVKRILTWGDPTGKKQAAEIDSIKLKGVKLAVKPPIEPFEANLTFTREGALKNAFFSGGGKWTLALKPVDKAMEVDFYARFWQLPVGAPIPVSEIKMKGTLSGNEIVFPEFEADAMEGKVNGTLRVTWGSGVKMESDLSVAKIRAEQLVSAITKDITVTGKLDGNFNVQAESPELATILSTPRAQGKFRLTEGSISNVDLVAVMQSDAAGQRAGVTKFAELTSEVSTGDHRTAFRNVVLKGGVLRGSGAIDIGQNSATSGRLLLEIVSQVAQDRGSFVVSGTVAKPSIRRGG